MRFHVNVIGPQGTRPYTRLHNLCDCIHFMQRNRPPEDHEWEVRYDGREERVSYSEDGGDTIKTRCWLYTDDSWCKDWHTWKAYSKSGAF